MDGSLVQSWRSLLEMWLASLLTKNIFESHIHPKISTFQVSFLLSLSLGWRFWIGALYSLRRDRIISSPRCLRNTQKRTMPERYFHSISLSSYNFHFQVVLLGTLGPPYWSPAYNEYAYDLIIHGSKFRKFPAFVKDVNAAKDSCRLLDDVKAAKLNFFTRSLDRSLSLIRALFSHVGNMCQVNCQWDDEMRDSTLIYAIKLKGCTTCYCDSTPTSHRVG